MSLTWELLLDADMTEDDWQFSAPTTATILRFEQVNAPDIGRFALGQATVDTFEFLDIKAYPAREESTRITLDTVGEDQRRIAIRYRYGQFPEGVANTWRVRIYGSQQPFEPPINPSAIVLTLDPRIAGAIPLGEKGVPFGVASLNVNGLVEEDQLPTTGLAELVAANLEAVDVLSDQIASLPPAPTLESLGGEPLGAELRAKQYTDEEISLIPPPPTLIDLGGEPFGAEARAKQYTDEEIAAIAFPPPPTLESLGAEPVGAELRAKTYSDTKLAEIEPRTLVSGVAGLTANNSISPSTLNISITGSRYIASRSFTCSSLQVLLSAGGTGKLKLAIYRLESTDTLTKLGESVERIGVLAGLQVFNLTANVSITQGGTYFICAFSDSGNNYGVSASSYSTNAYFFASSLNVYANGYPASITADKRTHYGIQLCLSVVDVEDVNKAVATLRDASLPNLSNRVGALEASGLPTQHVHIWGYGKAPSGKTFARSSQTGAELSFLTTLSTNEVGDAVEYEVLLGAGAYILTVYGAAATNRCVAAFFVDNDFVGSVNYNSSTANNRKIDKINFSVQSSGYHSIKVVNAGGNAVGSDNTLALSVLRIDPQVMNAVSPFRPVRTNAGKVATGYTDPQNNLWLPNGFWAGGGTIYDEAQLGTASTTIIGTDKPTIYRTECSGASLPYRLPVSPGSGYELKLHFCENFHSSAGQRVGGVTLNGATILNNFDVFTDAGGKHRALIKTFSNLTFTGEVCALTFTNTLINGIELVKA